jgi:hypothetical protein
MRSALTLGVAFLTIASSSCNWISLGVNAFSYETIARGEVANLVARDSFVYATRAEDGLIVVDARHGKVVATLPPPEGTESVDDVAVDGALLFILDARAPGYLSVYGLDDPARPHLVAPPRPVPVGPFSGVSARHGLAVVSGGTSELTAWRYPRDGTLTGPVATADLGRGQPDALVAPSGGFVFVSSHYWGPYFGLDVLRHDSVSNHLELAAKLALDGAGFTAGGAKPANFPIRATALGGAGLLVAYKRGVAALDLTGDGQPRLTRVIDVGGPAVDIDVRDSLAAVVVASPEPMLVILDLSVSPPRVAKRLSLPSGTFLGGVAFTSARVAVAAGRRGVMLFDQ